MSVLLLGCLELPDDLRAFERAQGLVELLVDVLAHESNTGITKLNLSPTSMQAASGDDPVFSGSIDSRAPVPAVVAFPVRSCHMVVERGCIESKWPAIGII